MTRMRFGNVTARMGHIRQMVTKLRNKKRQHVEVKRGTVGLCYREKEWFKAVMDLPRYTGKCTVNMLTQNITGH